MVTNEAKLEIRTSRRETEELKMDEEAFLWFLEEHASDTFNIKEQCDDNTVVLSGPKCLWTKNAHEVMKDKILMTLVASLGLVYLALRRLREQGQPTCLRFEVTSVSRNYAL